jgi:hypothetical protein
VFVADTSGGVLAIGEDGRRLWSITLEQQAIPVGSPAVANSLALFLDRAGALYSRRLEDGAPVAETELGILPAGGPIALGSNVAVPVGTGTARLWRE